MLSIAVVGLLCSVLGLLISGLVIVAAWLLGRSPTRWSLFGTALGALGTPLNAYHVWSLWP